MAYTRGQRGACTKREEGGGSKEGHFHFYVPRDVSVSNVRTKNEYNVGGDGYMHGIVLAVQI
jgi:hypothetical protein